MILCKRVCCSRLLVDFQTISLRNSIIKNETFLATHLPVVLGSRLRPPHRHRRMMFPIAYFQFQLFCRKKKSIGGIFSTNSHSIAFFSSPFVLPIYSPKYTNTTYLQNTIYHVYRFAQTYPHRINRPRRSLVRLHGEFHSPYRARQNENAGLGKWFGCDGRLDLCQRGSRSLLEGHRVGLGT